MLQGFEGTLQSVTDMMQGVDDRVKEIGDKVINSAQTVQEPCPLLSLFIRLGVEKTGRQTENNVDIDCEPEGAVDVDVVRPAKNVGSRVIASDGAQVFRTLS
jgi:hypothetical protein